MTKTRFVFIGACAIDHILEVPHYPSEDSKLRATSFTKRRGGNAPNTIEVLQQLLEIDRSERGASSVEVLRDADHNSPRQLVLISPLPAKDSSAITYIQDSFKLPNGRDDVDLSRCLYRNGVAEPISSYIFSSQATGSRTIVNHNELEEMSLDEFKHEANRILHESLGFEDIWFHFEGRIPLVTLQCMLYLRNFRTLGKEQIVRPHIRISVEVEKPGREGLQELAFEADVVFYSRLWASSGEGYSSATSCLLDQRSRMYRQDVKARDQLLICTWGEEGACAISASGDTELDAGMVVQSPASVSPGTITDTVGAGDTFISGMLFCLSYRKEWSLRKKLDFANKLAGRKIMQVGFDGLAANLARS